MLIDFIDGEIDKNGGNIENFKDLSLNTKIVRAPFFVKYGKTF